MTSAKDLLRVFEAIDKAHLQQRSVVLALTLSIEGQEKPEPMILEFEIMALTPELTDKPKGKKKR